MTRIEQKFPYQWKKRSRKHLKVHLDQKEQWALDNWIETFHVFLLLSFSFSFSTQVKDLAFYIIYRIFNCTINLDVAFFTHQIKSVDRILKRSDSRAHFCTSQARKKTDDNENFNWIQSHSFINGDVIICRVDRLILRVNKTVVSSNSLLVGQAMICLPFFTCLATTHNLIRAHFSTACVTRNRCIKRTQFNFRCHMVDNTKEINLASFQSDQKHFSLIPGNRLSKCFESIGKNIYMFGVTTISHKLKINQISCLFQWFTT